MSKGLLFVAVIALMDVVAQNFQKDKNDDFDHHDDQTIQKYHDFHYLEKYDRILRKSTQWVKKQMGLFILNLQPQKLLHLKVMIHALICNF